MIQSLLTLDSKERKLFDRYLREYFGLTVFLQDEVSQGGGIRYVKE
jgi:hypothetical protein